MSRVSRRGRTSRQGREIYRGVASAPPGWVLKLVQATSMSMTYFVDTLWRYVQLDVIGSGYLRMNRKVLYEDSVEDEGREEGRGFDAVREAHFEFLQGCFGGCFVDDEERLDGWSKFVRGSFFGLVSTCDTFCGNVEGFFERGCHMFGEIPGGWDIFGAEVQRQHKVIAYV